MIKNFLCGIDLFGVSVPITLNGKEKKVSNLGGVCSFFFFCFLGWAIYNSSESFFTKKDPKTFKFESYTEDPKQMTISSKSFPIGIQIRAPDRLLQKAYLNEAIYKVQIQQSFLEKIKSKNGTIQEKWLFADITVERCTPDHFREISQSFSNIELENLYCIAENQPKLNQIEIHGSIASSFYKSLTISVSECDNSTSFVPCAPKEIIDEYLEGSWFDIVYADLAINTQNFSNPASHFRDVYNTMMSRGYPKTTTIQLSNVGITTDLGWITESLDFQSFVKVNKVLEYFQVAPQTRKALMVCNIEVSNVEIYYSRSYKKIQNILAEVGGLANATFFIFLIAISPYLKFKLRESLMNELFEIKISPESHKVQKRKNSAIRNKTGDKYVVEESKSKYTDDLKKDQKDTVNGSKGIIKINNDQFVKDSPILQKKPSSLTPLHTQESPLLTNTPVKRTLKSLFHYESSSFSGLFSKPDNDGTISANTHNSNQRKSLNMSQVPLERNINLNEQIIDISSPNTSKSKINLEQSLNEQELINRRNKPRSSIAKKTHNKREDEKNSKVSNKKENQVSDLGDPRNVQEISHVKHKKFRLSVWEYICSFLYKSVTLKKKLKLMNKGIRNIDHRLDIMNILKKLRELDKIKALLLDHDQFILFNNLPRPEILPTSSSPRKAISFPHKALKKLAFVQEPGSEVQILSSHNNIKSKEEKTNIDAKLLEIFYETDSAFLLKSK